MTPPSAPPISEAQPQSSSSTLGGKEAILARFQAFQRGEDTSVAKEEPKQETPQQEAPPAKEEKPDASQAPENKPEAKQESSILPKEKELPKPPTKQEAKVEKPKSELRGSDGLNKEERAELLKFKEKASKVEELEAKLKDFEITTKELAELKALKDDLEQRAKTYEAKATAFDITSTPKWQETIAQPMSLLVKAMESLCESNGLPTDEVFAALENQDISKGNAALSEFMSSMNTLDQRSFDRMIGDMRDINRKGQELVAKAPEAWTALQAEQQKAKEEAKAKELETYKLANEAVFKAMQERFPFLKDETISKEVLEGATALDFEGMSPDAKAYYAQAGMTALHFNNIVKSKDEEIASLKAALKKHQPIGPNNGSRSEEKPEGQNQEAAMDGMTTGERMVAAIAGMRGR